MRDFAPPHKLIGAQEMHSAAMRILDKRRTDAYHSPYDVMVCLRSVEAAGQAIESIPVEGSALDFGQAISAALDMLRENYNDKDGEFTSKGLVGDIGDDVRHVLRTQRSSDRIIVSRDEARTCLVAQMNILAGLTPYPLTGVIGTTVKTDIRGASGFEYFIEMVFEGTSPDGVAMTGHIYADSSYRFPILEETRGLTKDSSE